MTRAYGRTGAGAATAAEPRRDDPESADGVGGFDRFDGVDGLDLAAIAPLRWAAWMLRLPDPLPPVAALLALAPDPLADWFDRAVTAQRRLAAAAADVLDAAAIVGTGWSNPTVPVRLRALADASAAGAAIVAGQLAAGADLVGALRAIRRAAEQHLADAAFAIRTLDLPVGPDLVAWAALDGRLDRLAAILTGLHAGLAEQQQLLRERLAAAAVGLRQDARDPLQGVPGTTPTSLAPGSTFGPSTVGWPPATAPASQPATETAVDPPGPDRIDTANLDQLDRDLRSAEPATRQLAQGVAAALAQAEAAAGTAQLLTYESAGGSSQGRVAIALGDVQSADAIALLIPGIATAPTAIGESLPTAAALRAEMARLAPPERPVVIAWYGYDMPLSAMAGVPMPGPDTIRSALAALDDDNARAGGVALTAHVELLRAHTAPSTIITTIGFSMGSVVASAAAADGAPVDNVLLLGSPGAGADVSSVLDYPAVPPDRTFVMAYEHDPVTRPGVDLAAGAGGLLLALTPLSLFGVAGRPARPFGPDPAGPGFGARVVDAHSNLPDRLRVQSGGRPELLGAEVADLVEDTRHHSMTNYLSDAELRYAAAVAVGRYAEVPVRPAR